MSVRNARQNDLWVFREGRKNFSGEELFRALGDAVDRLCANPNDASSMISALMRAGEFESGLADLSCDAEVPARKVTDALARMFIAGPGPIANVRQVLDELSRFEFPESLSVSPPEGFAYYALHPADFARLANRVAQENDSALVIGIRSIGTTLSAIIRAALQEQGKKTERLSVRPTGHPYDRGTEFTSEQLSISHNFSGKGADFLITDEGPGRSGSSFLSVAEALLRAGVAAERITMLGSRQADVNGLCAHDASARWTRFRFLWPESEAYARFSDHLHIGGGDWRPLMLGDTEELPACWPQMERLKFLSADRKFLYKFEGFGRFGEDVLARAGALASAGFGVPGEDADDGMVRYPVIEGQVCCEPDVSAALLEHFARYCAFRAAAFRTRDDARTQLPAMLTFNVMQEFGVDLGSETDELHSAAPVLTDGRMQPYEWLRRRDGSVLKVDAHTHGDDHFFPGPTDVAWDLAGLIVEWNLERSAADFLVSNFQRLTGTKVSGRIPIFTLGYAVFRAAYCKMALSTVAGTPEEERLQRAYAHYHFVAERQIERVRQSSQLSLPSSRLSVASSQSNSAGAQLRSDN